MNRKKEEIENFVTKVEDVSDQIKKIIEGNYNEEEYNELERSLNKEKYRKEEEILRKKKLLKQKELEIEKRKKGIVGNGEKENYKNFCKFCKVEYEIETKKCFRCKRGTQTQKERMDYLIEQMKLVKKKKIKKEESKKRWELWRKTQKIYKNKNLTDYEKWRHFTDSFDSDEEYLKNNPVLPKDNPQFKAMEIDINKRKKKREEDNKVAENLKTKGNKYFKQKNYYEAIQYYTKGIEANRRNKAIWLNRALAYIKFNKFKEAIKDCSEMIEYMEILENGFDQSKSFAIKAFMRRSQGYFEIDEIEKALNDAKKAKEIFNGEDKEINKHLEKIEKKTKLHKIIINKKFKEDLFSFKELLENEDFFNFDFLFKEITEKEEIKAQFLFNVKYGKKISKLLIVEKNNNFYSDENILKMSPILFVSKLIETDDQFVDYFKKSGTIYTLLKLLIKTSKLKEKNISNFFATEQILELLVETAMYHNGRSFLLEKSTILFKIFQTLINKAQKNKIKILNLVILSMKIFSNLSYNENAHINSKIFKNHFYDEFKNDLFKIFLNFPDLKTNFKAHFYSSAFILLTNLIHNKEIRIKFFNDLYSQKQYFFQPLNIFNEKCMRELKSNEFNYFLEKEIDLFFNLSFSTDVFKFKQLFNKDYTKTYTKFFIKNYLKISNNLLQKMIFFFYKTDLEKINSNLISAIIIKNFLENMLKNSQHKNLIKFLTISIKKIDKAKLLDYFKNLKEFNNNLLFYINGNYNEQKNIQLLNNTIVFISTLSDSIPELMENWGFLLEPLIFIVKERVGVLRKTAAILLAKLCRVKKLERKARELNATKLLVNLSKYLLE